MSPSDVRSSIRLRSVNVQTDRDISFAHWPYYDADELDAARRVLASGKTNYWTGHEARHFEREYA